MRYVPIHRQCIQVLCNAMGYKLLAVLDLIRTCKYTFPMSVWFLMLCNNLVPTAEVIYRSILRMKI
jgi:hypothetical protein